MCPPLSEERAPQQQVTSVERVSSSLISYEFLKFEILELSFLCRKIKSVS